MCAVDCTHQDVPVIKGIASYSWPVLLSALVSCCDGHLQLLGSLKGDEVWSATLEDAAADASHKLLLSQGDDVTLVAYTPG
jgi:hypothetical protein